MTKCHEFRRQMIEVDCKELDEDPVEAPSNAVVIPRLNK